MKSYVALSLAAAALASPMPQASASDSCPSTVSGTFQINTVLPPTKRDLEARQLSGALTMTLNGGILKDQAGRQGYIAANHQFQFDAPVQTGAIMTSGFSLCSNDSLAIGGSTIFYQCSSGDFYNLYTQSTGAQCSPIRIQAVEKSAGGAVSQISDGQPQASTAASIVSQISDGQPQAPSATSTPAVVTQISDGQPQAPSATSKPPVVTQISDGQPQAPAASSKPAVVTQISDGQPQAPAATSKPAVVTQISDGQPQAPAATSRASLTVSRNATSATATSSLLQYTGAAVSGSAPIGALAAGLFGLFAML
ncbi:hypothetical protein P153DRAFT_384073 [Dothidotthia symphoricarpi CBS 119687]|uniref:Cell wall mannoprotein PIR1-like C-terminal domain-containing protein n=1 Tax=Dothidotthia symphoricarpi CBS 119687 TaxID=1392245 RepID=A0A6A6AGD8_9PLEO|nr:uncharacterized protein P153DRAFT_384073 [Dothidotthia symphoricarpi CBS 119687]KAF2130850.1 hypothetical protein P153DRAFT_384073 [Dothidotthia symphoricarpi CBS 119687]